MSLKPVCENDETILENANKVLNINTTHLDSTDFHLVQYINELFPTEQALSNIGEITDNVRKQIDDIEAETHQILRGEWNVEEHGQKVINEITELVAQLFIKITDMQDCASSSERIVRDITKDIQLLDNAKKNLTSSVTVLNNVTILMNALEKLATLVSESSKGATAVSQRSSSAQPPLNPYQSSNLQWRQIADNLGPAQNVLEQLNVKYSKIPLIAKLGHQIDGIYRRLEATLEHDFKHYLGDSVKNIINNISIISQLCKIVDYLGNEKKQELIGWFVNRQLSEYFVLFESTQSTAWLDKIDHRYSWLRNYLPNFDHQYSSIFPVSWHIKERIIYQFCESTAKELHVIMTNRTREIDSRLFAFALQRTLIFEKSIHTLVNKDVLHEVANAGYNNSSTRASNDSIDGYISLCFEDFMYIYVDNLEHQLADQIVEFHAKEMWSINRPASSMEVDSSLSAGVYHNLPDNLGDADNTLSSSTELFLAYKKILKQSLQLTCGRSSLILITKLFKVNLRNYVQQILLAYLPGSKSNSAASDTEKPKRSNLSFANLNIANLNPNQFLTFLKDDQIRDEHVHRVSFASELELFDHLRKDCIQLLVNGLDSRCQVALDSMLKLSWSTLWKVGDTSSYVLAINNHCKAFVPHIRNSLSNVRLYFTQFCTKFASTLMPKYVGQIYKCKGVNTHGAEQLLLDTHSLKTLLLSLPVISSQTKAEPPRSYTNIIVQTMGKIEKLLKVVMTPCENVKSFIECFYHLLPDSDVAELIKILEIKGLKKNEWSNVTDVYKEMKRNDDKCKSILLSKTEPKK